jgi:AcrR family transcriptional regulator
VLLSAVDVTSDSSRERLLRSAKSLFARLGYEGTSTAAIARNASTSESQLVRGFRSKAGLLEAVFDEGWRGLNARVREAVTDAADGRSAVVRILGIVLGSLERDPDLATIMLLEGRRIRGDAHDVTLSAGFRTFADLIQRLIRRGQKDGSFAADLDPAAITAALMGGAEGMVRERLIARRRGQSRPFSDRQVVRVFGVLLDACAPRRGRDL